MAVMRSYDDDITFPANLFNARYDISRPTLTLFNHFLKDNITAFAWNSDTSHEVGKY